jgi:hypothetical protein
MPGPDETELPPAEPDFSRRVVSRRGEAFEFPTAEEARQALARVDARGEPLFTPDTPDAREERRLRREYGDRPLSAGGAAAASGATLGLSDAAGAALGYGEDLANLRRFNEGATVLGEVVGGIAPVLALGPLGVAGEAVEGASLLARGARLATAPARLTAGLAEAAGSVAGTAVRGAGSTALRRAGGAITRLAAEGAVEGMATEGGRLVSEAALGDPDLTAQAILARLGSGALMGAGTGAVLGVGGAALGEGVRATRRAAGGAADLLRTSWRNTVGTDLSPTVARAWAAVSGAEPDDLARVLAMTPDGRRIRELGARGEAVFDDGTRDVVRSLDALSRGRAHATAYWSSGLKRDQLVGRVLSGRLTDQASVASEALARIGSFADDAVTNNALFSSGFGATARRIRDRARAYEERLANTVRNANLRGFGGATEAEAREAAIDVFQALDDLKRSVGAARASRPRGAPEIEPLNELYESLRQTLERGDLWGEAADIQATVNRAFTNELSTLRAYERRFLGGDGSRSDIDLFNSISTADSRAINNFLRQAGTVANETAEGTYEATIGSTRDLLRVMRDHLDLPANVQADVARALSGSETALSTFNRARSDAADLNQWRRVMSSSDSTARGILAAVAGGAVGGPLGAGLAAAASSPSVAVRALGTMERLAGGAGEQITDSIRSFLGRASRGGVRVATEAGRRGRLAAVTGIEAFRARVREMDEERDPRRAAASIAERMAGLDAAPAVRNAVLATAMRARQHLEANRPRPLTLDGQIVPDSRAMPSPEERARFMRIARATDQPLTVLSDMRSGVLTPEAVEALRVVYPQLYEQIRVAIVRELGEGGGEGLSYDRRLSLGVLFGVPTDPSLTPSHLAVMAQMYAAQYTQPPSQSPAPDVASAAMSGMDALAVRR